MYVKSNLRTIGEAQDLIKAAKEKKSIELTFAEALEIIKVSEISYIVFYLEQIAMRV